MCHQSDGAGLAGQFPRLKGRVGQIATAPEGRSYLALVLLNGMYGKVTVDGQSISGMMPTMSMLSDPQIADLLNYVVGLKKPAKPAAAFTAAEIAKVRAVGKLSGPEVAAERARLLGKGLIP